MKYLLPAIVAVFLAATVTAGQALAAQPPAHPPVRQVPVVVFPSNWQPFLGGAYRYPYYPFDYGYSGYSGYYGPAYPYPYYPPYYYGPAYVPPVVIPTETLYGPQAVQRFMGVDQWFQPPNNGNGAVRGTERAHREDRPARAAPAQRATNADSVALAQKFIGYGDNNFGNQKYAEANERYRKATHTAPQLPDAWLHQGFALAAMGRYELAAAAFRHGLELKPDWPKSNFRLGELYDGNELAKTAHINALAKAAEEQPQNGDLLFLVGLHLWFDGKRDRAAPLFKRAAELAVGDKAHLKGFLENDE